MIDPDGPLSGRYDIAVEASRIAAVDLSLDASTERETLDVSGQLVVPGLVDLHC